eukprot:2245918-Rhodomonas_salina.1
MLHSCVGWVDSDFAADPDTRRSETGYLLSLNNNGPVSWKLKRQDCVTLSSAEAEYVAAISANSNTDRLRCGRITKAASTCQRIHPTANTAATLTPGGTMYATSTVRDRVIKLKKVAGQRNVADANTKSLPGPAFKQHREYMWGTRVLFQAVFSCARVTGPEITLQQIAPAA